MKNSLRLCLLASVAAVMPSLGMATTLFSLNLDNVVPGPVPFPDDTEYSVIYQGDPATAETNGRIAYTDPEAVTPGLITLNDPYTSGQGSFDGCIRASTGVDECATGFRTGNRFKLQMTDTGAIDLVFDIDPYAVGTQGGIDPDTGEFVTPGVNTYQVFGRAVNLTTQMLDGFIVELGFGVGDGFTASGDGDGLSFAQNLQLGPNDAPVFTQFPFGLFGEADDNPRFSLDGFFDDDRAGFDVAFDGEDTIRSEGLYGGDQGYEARFGNWLSQEMAPAGLLWDDDGLESTDALVMAWQRDDGLWEALRSIDALGNPISILSTPQTFADQSLVEAFFQSNFGAILDFEEHIEDLANLNLNFGIALEDGFMGWFDSDGILQNNFTLRLVSVAASVPSPVPLPASVLLLLAAVGSLGAKRRLRKSPA